MTKMTVFSLQWDSRNRQRWKGRQLLAILSPRQLAISMKHKTSRRGSLPETVRILPAAALPYPANPPQLRLHRIQPSQLHRNLTSLKEEQLSWRLSSPVHLMASLSVSAVQGRRFLTLCKISPQFNRKRLPTVYLLRRGPSSQCTFHRTPSFQ